MADAGPPAAPLALVALPAGDDAALLTWQPPVYDGGHPILEYRIYRAPALGTPVVVGLTATTTFVDVPDAPQVKAYEYRVAAVNANGEGPPSLSTLWVPPTKTTGGCVHLDPWSLPPGVVVDSDCIRRTLHLHVGIP